VFRGFYALEAMRREARGDEAREERRVKREERREKNEERRVAWISSPTLHSSLVFLLD
jgi:hypothetical protein